MRGQGKDARRPGSRCASDSRSASAAACICRLVPSADDPLPIWGEHETRTVYMQNTSNSSGDNATESYVHIAITKRGIYTVQCTQHTSYDAHAPDARVVQHQRPQPRASGMGDGFGVWGIGSPPDQQRFIVFDIIRAPNGRKQLQGHFDLRIMYAVLIKIPVWSAWSATSSPSGENAPESYSRLHTRCTHTHSQKSVPCT